MKKPALRIILGLSVGLSLLPLGGCVPVVAGGVGAGILMAEDRRTSGTYLMDEEIELRAANRIRESHGENTHVNVTSYNRRVLLTGEAPDAAVRAKVQDITKGVPNVREVLNELVIGGTTTFTARTNDSYLTAKVKARFLDDKRFNVHHVKVVTEAGTVFLIGMVKREEGNAAAEVAARTSGVSKVVKVFEYMD
jgi:osmotically-inducible protein OsmY